MFDFSFSVPVRFQTVKKSAETPYQKPQANKPYGTKEGFEAFKVSA